MNETTSPQPPESPMQPFSPPPAGRGPRLGGVSPVAIGCAGLFVLLGLAAIFALSRAEDMFAYLMGRVETQLLENVSAEVPVAVRSDFRNAFAELVQGVKDKEVSTSHLQLMQTRLLEVAKKGKGEVTEEDLVRLSRALRGEEEPEMDPASDEPESAPDTTSTADPPDPVPAPATAG